MPPLPVRVRLNGVHHWETRLPATSAWYMMREKMYMTFTSHSQLLRRLEAASPSEGAARLSDNSWMRLEKREAVAKTTGRRGILPRQLGAWCAKECT